MSAVSVLHKELERLPQLERNIPGNRRESPKVIHCCKISNQRTIIEVGKVSKSLRLATPHSVSVKQPEICGGQL